MSEHGHDHDDADERRNALRVEALETILREKGLLDSAQVDALIRHYEEGIGPLNGARMVARAWTDDAYRRRLLENATAAAAELGFSGPQAEHLVALENSTGVHHVVVCTLCSCYPWPVLGLPPSWYKSPAYRSRVVREPRAVLREMGLELPERVEVRVWDSSSEVRYLVLPERPPASAGLDEAALAAWVTRDSMIGVGLPRAPQR